LSWFTPAWAGAPPSDKCKVQTIELPDPANLPDGEHVIKEADTDGGRFQAHITVKNKAASRPWFSIAGRRLRDISESQVPKDAKSCLDEAQRQSGIAASTKEPISITRFSNAFAPAPVTHCRVVWVTCGEALDGSYYCVAKACCNGVCAFGSY
jgi:hypothetical protein